MKPKGNRATKPGASKISITLRIVVTQSCRLGFSEQLTRSEGGAICEVLEGLINYKLIALGAGHVRTRVRACRLHVYEPRALRSPFRGRTQLQASTCYRSCCEQTWAHC